MPFKVLYKYWMGEILIIICVGGYMMEKVLVFSFSVFTQLKEREGDI